MPYNQLFSEDFRTEPYWWNPAHRPPPPPAPSLPQKTDVLVIGAGYTGLHSAIQTVRAGRETVVIDAAEAGHGCSTRNGGQISTSVKPDVSALKRRFGEKLAREILLEGLASRDYVAEFVSTEKIDCDFEVSGRFEGAHTPRMYEKLARECEEGNGVFDTGAYAVPRAEQHRELGTDYYFGGMVMPRNASLDPAKYHAGIMAVAGKAGVVIVPRCRAIGLSREKSGFTVRTSYGDVRALSVIIATNGYTGKLTPELQRRVVPIGSYIIATEELPDLLVKRLFPTRRMVTDTRRLVFYYRTTPDRKRILFGGRVSLSETDPRRSAPILKRDMVALFPELARYRISHSWMGFVAFTFDKLMHAGEDDGLFYTMGYCGSGVGMASYLGMRIGRQAAGFDRETTVFGRIPFPAAPLYCGRPWFLGASILGYRIADRLGI